MMSKSRRTKTQTNIKCHTITSLFNKQIANAKSQGDSVICPACSANISKSIINEHLDNECNSVPLIRDPSSHTGQCDRVKIPTSSPDKKGASFILKSPELKKFCFEQKNSHLKETDHVLNKKKQRSSLSKKLSLKKNESTETSQMVNLNSSQRHQKIFDNNSSEIIATKNSNLGNDNDSANNGEEIEILQIVKSNSIPLLSSDHEMVDIAKAKRQLSFDADIDIDSGLSSNVRDSERNCNIYKEKQNDLENTVKDKKYTLLKSSILPKNKYIDESNVSEDIPKITIDSNVIEVSESQLNTGSCDLQFDDPTKSEISAINFVNLDKSSVNLQNNIQKENIKTPEKLVKHSTQQQRSGKSTPCTPVSSQSSTPKSIKSSVSSPRTPTKSPEKQRPYYLENFLLVLKSVTTDSDDGRFFNKDDREAIDNFFNMSVPAQQLYVRIFQRKHHWIPLSKLDYKNIAEDLLPVLNELCIVGFLENESSLSDLMTTLELLSLPDLKMLIKIMNIKSSATQKTQLVEHILQYGRQQRTFSFGNSKNLSDLIFKRALSLLGPCFKIKVEPQHLFFRCLILFSLTSYHDEESEKNLGQSQLLTLLFVNMGKLTFPPYHVVRDKAIFRSRDDLIQYETAYRYELKILGAIEAANWDDAYNLYVECKDSFQSILDNLELSNHVLNLPKFLRRYTAGVVYSRCLTQGVEVLQKQKNYKKAVEQLEELLQQDIYNQDYRGRWVDRLALNLEQHLKLHEKALSAIKEGLQDPNVHAGHRLSLSQRAVRICNSKSHRKLKKLLKDLPLVTFAEAPKVFIQGRLFPRNIPGRKSVFISQQSSNDNDDDTIICSVEEVALNHYAQLGYTEGIHGESATFLTLYGLLFWDIIYQSGFPDVFRSPHQALPLDIYTEEFYFLRKVDILERLKRIEQSTTEELMLLISEPWHQYNGAVSIVSWNRFDSVQQIEDLISCIGGKLLAGICERFAKDYRHCHSGFPDLVVWNLIQSVFKIVEVKGPNDHLSQKQILWLDYLLSLGVDAEVCHVAAIGWRNLKRKIEDDLSQEL